MQDENPENYTGSAGNGLTHVYSLRTSGWLGYLANDLIKIQVGGEYRVVELWAGNRPFLFLLTTLVFSLQ